MDHRESQWVINPYDEFALEEALKIKDQKKQAKISVLSVGPEESQPLLRSTLALGADEATLIKTSKNLSPGFVAHILASEIKKDLPDLILVGKSGIDYNHSVTGFMLAECLNLPHAGFITQIKEEKEGFWLCERKEPEKTRHFHLRSPALISVEKSQNTLRHPSLVALMKAKTRPLKLIPLKELALKSPPFPEMFFHSFQAPPAPPKARLFTSSPEEQAKQFIHLLKEKKFI